MSHNTTSVIAKSGTQSVKMALHTSLLTKASEFLTPQDSKITAISGALKNREGDPPSICLIAHAVLYLLTLARTNLLGLNPPTHRPLAHSTETKG